MIRPESVLKTSLRDVLKMSWRRLEDVLKTFWRPMTKANILVLIKTSWRRLLTTYEYSEYVCLDQDVLMTSSEDEDERRLQDVFKTSLSRRMFAGIFFFHILCYYSSHYKHLESHLFLSSIVFIVSTLIIGIFHCLNYTLILLPLIITHLVIDFVITM